jgi:hypothetical protein
MLAKTTGSGASRKERKTGEEGGGKVEGTGGKLASYNHVGNLG